MRVILYSLVLAAAVENAVAMHLVDNKVHGLHYYELYDTKLEYENAKSFAANSHIECVNDGGTKAGYLVRIDDHDENTAVTTLLQSLTSGDRRAFIGGSDANDENAGFKWANGDSVEYTNWAPGQPDNYHENEDCIHIGWNSPEMWNDVPCAGYSDHVVVEYDCIPAGYNSEFPMMKAVRSMQLDGHVYAVYNQQLTFQEAQTFASSQTNSCGEPAYLVEIGYGAENSAVGGLVHALPGGDHRAFLGGSDKDTEGVFQWLSGADLTYSNWAEGEPNDWGSGEDCIHIGYKGYDKWNDNNCEAAAYVVLEYNCVPDNFKSWADEIAAGDMEPVYSIVYQGHHYELYNRLSNYEDSRDIASSLTNSCGSKGYLASITSKEENEMIAAMLGFLPSDAHSAIIGATDKDEEGKFKWSNGDDMSYESWAKNEPNDYSDGEDCVMIGFAHNEATGLYSMWNDMKCASSLDNFVVEYDCAPDDLVSSFKPLDTYSFNNHQYDLYGDKLSYHAARLFASTQMNECFSSGYVVTITSEEENTFVAGMLNFLPNGGHTALTGATDRDTEGNFKWETGEHFIYKNWGPGEPNDYSDGEDCVHVGWGSSNTVTGLYDMWNDIPCSHSDYFIIEYDCTVEESSKFCSATSPRSRWHGDPHLETFNGLAYDCQGEGEFVMARSYESEFKLHARFVEVAKRPSVSVTRGVAFTFDDDGHKVSVTVPEYPENGVCTMKVFVDGEDVSESVQTAMSDVAITKHNYGSTSYLSAWFEKEGHRFVISQWGNDYWGCVLDVNVCLHEESVGSEKVHGLLGALPGDDIYKDWPNTQPGIEYTTIPSTRKEALFQTAFEWCTQQWCVGSHSDSLFDDGETAFDKFNKCPLESEPYGTQSDSTNVLEYNDSDEQVYDRAHDPETRTDADEEIKKACEEKMQGIEAEACIFDATIMQLIGEDEGKEGEGLKGVEAEVNRRAETIQIDPDGGSKVDEKNQDTVPPADKVPFDFGGGLTEESGNIAVLNDSGVSGDPHLKTWKGEKFDYHGICDLVLLQNPLFRNKAGMEVHIRTRKTKMWSYVSSAVLRIGDHMLEVMGAGAKAKYWVDGVENPEELGDLSGYSISFEHVHSHQYKFVVALDIGSIVIETFKNMVRVDFHNIAEEDFASSLGLLGDFGTGEKVGRDKLPIDDINEFGQEWQVLASEDMLFRNVEGPQAPQKCTNPAASSQRRRLGESSISEEEAQTACSKVGASDFDLCVFDVLATNDLDIPGSY